MADDDHGPLTLQEILLAGWPVVGVRTRAPFLRDGVTGVFTDRLPPGAKWVKNDADKAALAAFVEGIQRGQRGFRHGTHRRSDYRCTGNGPFPWTTSRCVSADRLRERRHSDFGPTYWVATTTSSYQTVRVVPPPARA